MSTNRHAIVQVGSCWLLTIEEQVHVQGSPHGTCGGLSGIWTGSSLDF
jgi:hypothetical protein